MSCVLVGLAFGMIVVPADSRAYEAISHLKLSSS